MRSILFAILLLLAGSYARASEYAIVKSDFEYTDISDTYARTVYGNIRSVIFGYLADGATAPEFFCDLEFDSVDQQLKNLDSVREPLILTCRMSRMENELHLTVSLANPRTEQPLLFYKSSTPFFKPEEAISSFSRTFCTDFQGPVYGEFSYVAPTSGFVADTFNVISLGAVRYHGTSGNFAHPDLESDLKRTIELTPEVRRAFDWYKRIRIVEAVTALASVVVWDVTFLGGSVVMAVIGQKALGPYMTVYADTLLVTGITAAVVGIDLIFRRPTRLASILDKWVRENW